MARSKKNDTGIVYCYTSPSGKQYVGQTWNEEIRQRVHRTCAGRCTAFYSAIKKYGYDNFQYEVLYSSVLTQEEMDRLECLEIKGRNTLSPNGYNLDEGGANGKASEETRKKQSLARIGKKPAPRKIKLTDEQRVENRRKTLLRESEKNKQKRREKRELLIAMGLPVKKKKPKETNKGFCGLKPWKAKAIICIETGQIFNKIEDARMPERKIWPSAISRVCYGYELTAGGLHFEFLNGPRPDLSKLKYHKKTWHEVDRRIKRVKCVETGIEYNSMNIAGKANGMSGASIARSILNNKASRGLHWEIVGFIERKKK